MPDGPHESGAIRMTMLFATGALVGAGFAILFAPRSGKKSRALLASKTNDLKEAASDAIERGKHFAEDVKHRAHEAYEKGKEVARETIEG